MSDAAMSNAVMRDGGTPVDNIRLTGLRVFAHHGVLDFERENGQEFIIDLEIAVDLAPAAPVSVGDRIDLESAIARLPTGARRIFVLHDVEGFTHEEIGLRLGITPGGSKAQLHRARMLLRAALSR